MSTKEEVEDAIDMAKTLLNEGGTPAQITTALNRYHKGSFSLQSGTIYMANKPDYAPPHLIIKCY